MNSRRFMSGMGTSLYGALSVKEFDRRRHFSSVSLFDPKARFFIPTSALLTSARIGSSHRPCGHASPLPGYTLTAPSTTARLVRSGDDQRGARCAISPPIDPCARRSPPSARWRSLRAPAERSVVAHSPERTIWHLQKPMPVGKGPQPCAPGD